MDITEDNVPGKLTRKGGDDNTKSGNNIPHEKSAEYRGRD
jgi:hypothetical protein